MWLLDVTAWRIQRIAKIHAGAVELRGIEPLTS